MYIDPFAVRSSTRALAGGGEILVITVDGRIGEASEEVTRTIADLISKAGATSFLITTGDPALQEVIKRWGGTVINTICYFHLRRDGTDHHLVMAEHKDIATGELTMASYESVPEALYEPVAALMTECMNDILREDSRERFAETAEGLERKMTRFKETGVQMPLFLLFDRQQEVVGLSFVLIKPHSAGAKQELTGIRRAYRGRKLAYFLKALAVRETFSRYPHVAFMETNCYSVNKPIIHINKVMGYTPTDSSLQFLVDMEVSPGLF